MNKIEKQAQTNLTYDPIPILPSAIVGALTGAAAAKMAPKKMKDKDLAKFIIPPPKKTQPKVEGSYYKQVQNIVKNLKIIFTPLSVIYTVNNDGSTFTLDTLETSEMNQTMKDKWKAKDEQFFKELLISKMYSEIQIAEQSFAKRFLQTQQNIKEAITKEVDSEFDLEEKDAIEIIDCCVRSKDIYHDDLGDRLANIFYSDMEKVATQYFVEPKLLRPIEKYAGLVSGIQDCLGLHSDKPTVVKIRKQLSDPKYVMGHIKIGFMPDRVVFVLDNQLISTLPLTSMNEEGFAHFEKNDSKYFKALFVDKAKENLEKTASLISMDSKVEPASSEIIDGSDIRNIFYKSNIHPVLYYLALINGIGPDWIKMDIAVIEKIIQTTFNLENPIGDVALNKIIAIMVANQSENLFTNSYSLGKIILSLNSKPVNFLTPTTDISIDDITFALDILDRVTPNDDIYDNFNPETIEFLANRMADKDMYVYSPSYIVSSPTEPAFLELLNEFLLIAIKRKMTKDTINPIEERQINNKCAIIADNSNMLIKSIRRTTDHIHEVNKNDLVTSVMKKSEQTYGDLTNIIKQQVLINLAIDDILAMNENALRQQLEIYNIGKPQREGILIEQ